MERNDPRYGCYIKILTEELVPAMGCTEPIALAFAAAKARDLLGQIPERILLQVSGSIIKNVKSVVVPGTNQSKGLQVAAVAGAVVGHPEKELEVLSAITEEERRTISRCMEQIDVEIEHIELGHVFDIIITASTAEHSAKVRIADNHTNIVLLEKDGEIMLEKPLSEQEGEWSGADHSCLTMEGIWDFATSCDVSEVEEILERQIQYNCAIAEEGMKNDYGANIGKVLLKTGGDGVRNRAKAYAAAASDARMNGCEMPVIINSGSGNQGITCSVPLVEYAKELKSEKEQIYRALLLSNLTAIHIKDGIGTLSAYCGAVSAGASAGAGIAYLLGGDYSTIIHTVVNSLAIVSGIVCDGAKPSCAAKIASSVDAGILGYEMYCYSQEFKAGDGIVMKGVEETIRCIGRLGRDGMKETNDEILSMMVASTPKL